MIYNLKYNLNFNSAVEIINAHIESALNSINSVKIPSDYPRANDFYKIKDKIENLKGKVSIAKDYVSDGVEKIITFENCNNKEVEELSNDIELLLKLFNSSIIDNKLISEQVRTFYINGFISSYKGNKKFTLQKWAKDRINKFLEIHSKNYTKYKSSSKIGVGIEDEKLRELILDKGIDKKREVDGVVKPNIWSILTGGMYDHKPSAQEYTELDAEKMTAPIEITVRTGPNTEEKKEIKVNRELKDLWSGFFKDLYNECPDFYISANTIWAADYREVINERGNTGELSSHSFGASIDLNSDIEFKNGKEYNAQYEKPLTKEEWEKLDDPAKYYIIYNNSKMLDIAEKYGLSWGGYWDTSKDNMHFSFIGDWSREGTIEFYENGRKKIDPDNPDKY